MKKLTFILLVTFLSLTAYSQSKSEPWTLGIHVGAQQYNGELGNQFFDFIDHYNGLAGFSVGHYLSPSFDLALDVTLGDIKFFEERAGGNLWSEYDMQQANLHLKYNILKEDKKVRPFVFAGLGILRFKGTGYDEVQTALPAAGGGVNFKISENVSFRYQNTFLLSNADNIDMREEDGNESYLQTTVGIYTALTKTMDEDQDGVSDKNDKCPGTVPGTKVNKEGCPVDRDADGVLNEVDKCPDVAGKVELAGCPDSDNDGIVDAEDACPNKAGTKEMGGCPDTDEDGIADNVDKCPEEAGTAEREGCPEPVEVEKMGMYTYNKLPLKNGTLVIYDENGVAVDTVLTDENGTFRYTDLDPDKNYSIKPINFEGDDNKIDIYLVDNDGNKTHGTTKAEDGKFVFRQESKKPKSTTIPDELFANIMFNSSSSTINIKYYSQLDRLAKLAKENNVKLYVEGHADSSGPLEFNNRLAQKRADRVKAYLVKKGMKADMVDAVGKGIDEPATSNETAEGRTQNRRVELEVR